MSKDKWVRRFSVDETARHKNGFTIYKITSVLFPLESPETITVISVWKRFSDIQKLHASMRSLHAGLHLRGTFPILPKFNYFKRFQKEVIEQRGKAIKSILEFIAEHKLLFTSTDFVNFLQTGYPEPEGSTSGVINSIRSSLHLPIEETPPLEYQTSDDDRSPRHAANTHNDTDELDSISFIPIHSSSDIERRETVTERDKERTPSISSLESISSDLYSELDKVTIEKSSPMIKKNVLPDLINFDEPSTSRFDDYHTMRDDTSLSSNQRSERSASTNQRSERSASTNQRPIYSRSDSRVSNRSVLSLSTLSNVECKTRTEDSYVFEAGYLLNMAARYEDMKEYSRAFDCYKAGIEKMLIGVQTDSDHQRRALIKEKTNKYLSYAENIYKNHLCDVEQTPTPTRPLLSPPPLSMLRRPRADLAHYRVLAVLGRGVTLALHSGQQTCYAIKVIRKIPKNLTEFDEYFLQNTNETRQPILPTVIPYMVPLHAYIETNNLIFLILSYAPGEKLFDYIKNYAKSMPTTPAREVNLENVFNEPMNKKIDAETKKTNNEENEKSLNLETKKLDNKENSVNIDNIENIQFIDDVTDIEIRKLEDVTDLEIEEVDFNKSDYYKSEISIIDRLETNSGNSKTEDIDVTELVKNSQKLLKNVDKVLKEVPSKELIEPKVKVDNLKVKVGDECGDVAGRRKEKEKKLEPRVETIRRNKVDWPAARLPSGAVRAWGAQLLAAIGGLHCAGVVCRDLNPSNILLGDNGQIILTYIVSYPGTEMALRTIRAYKEPSAYIAPELYRHTFVEEGACGEGVCDFWSFGAIMYELMCGEPLPAPPPWRVQPPPSLPLEARELLTQLLTYEPSERLGSGKDGIEEIKRHPYFKNVDWAEVYDSWRIPD